jgi:hypothetical protein
VTFGAGVALADFFLEEEVLITVVDQEESGRSAEGVIGT